MLFRRILDEQKRRVAKSKGPNPNKIWIDKGSEFRNGSMKSWLEINDIEIYSTHNKG